MPADDCIRRDERQVLAPAGAPSASQHPEQLVPGTKPSTWSGASGTGQDGELMAPQQVLEYEIPAAGAPRPARS